MLFAILLQCREDFGLPIGIGNCKLGNTQYDSRLELSCCQTSADLTWGGVSVCNKFLFSLRGKMVVARLPT